MDQIYEKLRERIDRHPMVAPKHPAVEEAAVIGIPDETWGESVKDLVVLKKGKSATEQEIIDYCKENFASYKKPKSVDFIDELPKNPSGKVMKHVLKEQYWKGKETKIL